MEMMNMVETNIMEEIDVVTVFDQIDELLEFPNDFVDTDIFGSATGDGCIDFPPVWSEEDLTGFSSCHSHSASDLSAELSVPYEDIVQLEWLSTFVEDSFSGGGLTLSKPQITSSENKDSFQNQFQTSSPVSVLESSTSVCFRSNPLPVSHEKRARSKRPRPATFSPRAAIHLIAPGQPASVSSSESGIFGQSYAFKSVDKKHKKRKIKILPLSGTSESDVTIENQNTSAGPVRKCRHCEIMKTPQWRAGPLGPKTLCNACGVRYKSGRLYPEYRPAASPTFVPLLHSNSHKKVLEMRGVATVKAAHHTQKADVVMPNMLSKK